MFLKSRRKIVISIVGALLLLLAVTVSVIIITSYFDTKKQNAEMISHYVELYSIDNQPGEDDEPPDLAFPPAKAPLFQLSTFYSVALSASGDVLAIDNGRNGIYSEEELLDIADTILNSKKDSGRTSGLTFRVESKDGYTLVAFMDNTVTDNSFQSLIRYTLIFGGIAILICFVFADYIAYRIVRPLEDNDKKQKQFVSDAGHELKTPISVISANAELLSRQIGSNEWLENIRYENERMGELVTQLLDLSRAENAQLQMEETDFSHLVTGEVLSFESIAFDKGLTIQSDIEDGIRIIGNRSQLAQLASILLDNAVRHSDGGHEIGISLCRQDHHTLLTVVNNGKELTSEQQNHLFDRFYRADDVRNSESRHYGLGLAIAKAIADAHKGYISVDCHSGKVIFTVLLPIQNS